MVRDHSIGLFHRIFRREGLSRIFADARRACENPGPFPIGGDANIRRYINRFLSEEERWLSSIGRLTDYLRGRDREWGHLLALANGALPSGPRFEARLQAGEGVPDSAPLLASALLADLADFITVCLDPGFRLIRYLPHTGGAGFRDFGPVRKSSGGYILDVFYRPYLEAEWQSPEFSFGREAGPLLLGLTVPFPGCLPGALACAESAKRFFGERVLTLAGGGYINTELRFLEEEKIFDYFDYLCFDRGYGSWEAILETVRSAGKTPPGHESGRGPLHQTRYRNGTTGGISGAIQTAAGKNADDRGAKTVFPDYTGVDFSRYLCPVDDKNPMFRLWSDGRWLKAYLAHGCYWHNCAFCDVGLDYIRSYIPVDPAALFEHLLDQAEKTGIRGVHLVDEAAPPSALFRLARLNRAAGLPLVFWGNIRFEKAFTPDTAALLAAGGLAGVSGGIEIASGDGFRRIGKGFDLRGLIRACAAFKEAGILTHGYLIYGYWDQDEQEIMDAAETVGQLFSAGLLDSAFWHKFVLTRHSRLYAEWEKGGHPKLRIRENAGSGGETPGPVFALNDLSFEGEEKYDRYTEGLDKLLAAWMAGDFSHPLQAAFPFTVPTPAPDPGLVKTLLDEYARNRDRDRRTLPDPQKPARAVFLGSKPLVHRDKNRTGLFWRWKLEDTRLRIGEGLFPKEDHSLAEKTAALLEKASRPGYFGDHRFYRELEAFFGPQKAPGLWRTLRAKGLVCY
jgi:hypothetical protein